MSESSPPCRRPCRHGHPHTPIRDLPDTSIGARRVPAEVTGGRALQGLRRSDTLPVPC